MKYLILLPLLLQSTVFGQLDLAEAKEIARANNVRAYTYHATFEGHAGYGAPLVLTADSGAVFWAEGEEEGTVAVVKLNAAGEVEWKYPIHPAFSELETQSVVQGPEGGFYAFILSYNYAEYRGAVERVLHFTEEGELSWDKRLGAYELVGNPHCSYIRALEDGRIEMRGHIVNAPRSEGGDPEYRFWKGWLDASGTLSQEVAEVIDWAAPEWKAFLEVRD